MFVRWLLGCTRLMWAALIGPAIGFVVGQRLIGADCQLSPTAEAAIMAAIARARDGVGQASANLALRNVGLLTQGGLLRMPMDALTLLLWLVPAALAFALLAWWLRNRNRSGEAAVELSVADPAPPERPRTRDPHWGREDLDEVAAHIGPALSARVRFETGTSENLSNLMRRLTKHGLHTDSEPCPLTFHYTQAAVPITGAAAGTSVEVSTLLPIAQGAYDNRLVLLATVAYADAFRNGDSSAEDRAVVRADYAAQYNLGHIWAQRADVTQRQEGLARLATACRIHERNQLSSPEACNELQILAGARSRWPAPLPDPVIDTAPPATPARGV